MVLLLLLLLLLVVSLNEVALGSGSFWRSSPSSISNKWLQVGVWNIALIARQGSRCQLQRQV